MFFGNRIDLKFTSEESRKKFLEASKKMAEGTKEMERIKQSDIPAREKVVKLVDLFDSTYRKIDPGITGGKPFIDWVLSGLEDTVQRGKYEPFFAATRYQEHVKTLDCLLRECVSNGRYEDVKQFLESAEKVEAFSGWQVFFARLVPAYEFVHEVFPITRTRLDLFTIRINVAYQLVAKDPISREDIDRGLQYYRDFAGEFEKQVAVITGLLEILAKDVKMNYSEIKGRGLGPNIAEVEKNEKYRSLVTPFSKTIRNALAHPEYVVNPIEEKVTFSDKHGSLTLTYLEFLREFADLSGLVLALWSPRLNLTILVLKRIKNIYDQAKGGRQEAL